MKSKTNKLAEDGLSPTPALSEVPVNPPKRRSKKTDAPEKQPSTSPKAQETNLPDLPLVESHQPPREGVLMSSNVPTALVEMPLVSDIQEVPLPLEMVSSESYDTEEYSDELDNEDLLDYDDESYDDLNPNQVNVTLSYSLMNKVKQMAQQECVSVEFLLTEYISEGVTRRVFEDQNKATPSHLQTRTGYIPPEAQQFQQPTLSHHQNMRRPSGHPNQNGGMGQSNGNTRYNPKYGNKGNGQGGYHAGNRQNPNGNHQQNRKPNGNNPQRGMNHGNTQGGPNSQRMEKNQRKY